MRVLTELDNVFRDDFYDRHDIENEYKVKLTDERILFASYTYENYTGNSVVFFL